MRAWQTLAPALLICIFGSISSLAGPGDCATKGDGNGDCRIAFDDFEDFSVCMTGPGLSANPVCVCYDENDDGDTDLLDFAYLQAAFTGTGLIAGCDMTAGDYEPGTQHAPKAAGVPRSFTRPLRAPAGIGTSTYMAPEVTLGVYTFSGEIFSDAVDLHIPGRGIDFVWARKYRSRVGPDTAQGVGWDYGYNVRIEVSGGDLILHDGNTRADLYRALSGPQGTIWCAPEFFREISQDPNGSYICRFAGRDIWRFHPFDASNQEGKLVAIADTNGNSLSFAYNPAGRLTTITDTLSRVITVGYTVGGRISAVTDYTGRQIQYDYYAAGDPNGSPGDLKSVRSPVVTGTPNGNDFQLGKTVRYTYSTGFADNALNHNLLTITDAKGQTYLTNTYAATLDPNNADFDRVARQVLGDPNDIIDYVYESPTPSAGNGYAVRLTLVNDRNGHVDEYLYDKFNRCVEVRELTGQAGPGSPTTSSTNRPTGKLRQGDPNAFVTRFEYNDNALTVRMTDAEQSVRECAYEGDLDLFAPARAKGNLRVDRRDPGPRGGNQTELVTEYEYDAFLNSDTNQVTRDIDPRGNDTLHEYDAAGNRTRITHRIPSIVEDFEYNAFGQLTAHVHPDNGSGHRRRDESTYYNAGPLRGYLQDSIVDAPGLALTTTYEYDAVGNVVRTIDPRGNDTLRIVNQLDQVVRLLSRPVDPNNPVRYEVDTFYDENDNVVRVDVQNRDETGALYPNSAITTLYNFDILDKCIRVTKEVDPNNDVVVEYEYDANRNRVLVRNGEATNGTQPTNTATTVYDERDLVFQEIIAVGDAQQSTTQVDYDQNGNIVRTAQGLEGAARVTTYGYDGYDRLMPTTDPMGNLKTCQYDANGNRVFHRLDGELLDVPGSAGNVRLTEKTFTYDAMDRRTRSDVEFFDATTQSPIDDGLSSTTTVYSDNSQVLSVTDDNSHVTTIQYDTANRRLVVTDPKNNTTTYVYDDNSNVVNVTETEKSDLGLPDEDFVIGYTYDALDRLTTTTDSSGNTNACGYDSRDNRVVSIDALFSEVRWDYDGLDRLLKRTSDLDGDGADGDGTDIVVTHVWDDSSRCIQRVDDNGNATVTSHDPLNRPAFKNFADGTSESYTYDPHHNVVNRVDANGSSFSSSYDALDRLTNNTIVVGPGVSADTTFENFTYDGLSRTTLSQDDGVVSTFTWTSLSDMTQETLDGQATVSTYDGVGNRLSCTYPGGRTLDYTYDTLDRLSTIDDGPTAITSYLYVGPERVALQQYGNGARTTFTYDGIQGTPNPPQDFGVKCIVGITHTSGPTVVDARTFTWDRMYNKTERRDIRAAGRQLRHAYEYDDAYRMTRGVEENGIGIVTRQTDYNLDGVGNRTSLGGFGGLTGPYLLDPSVPPADLQVNQYTATPRDARQYDEKGNLATVVSPIGTTDQEYDAYDRLVFRVDSLTGDTATYAYDALGRRFRRTVTPNGGPPEETRYFYDGPAVIEDQDPNAVTLATYVRGARGNDIVCVESGGTVVYQHSDDAGNVMALTDPNGVTIERYEYDDFGAPRIFDGVGAPLATSSVGNLYMFGGRLYDPETGWYLHGNRYLDPQNGRYVTRDRAGMWNDSGAFGNAYTYAGGNPWSTGRGPGGKTERKSGSVIISPAQAGADTETYYKALIGLRRSQSSGGIVPVLAHDDFIRFIAPPGGGGGRAQGPGELTRGNFTRRSAVQPGSYYNAAVTVVFSHGDHNGHVTILKAMGGGGGGHNGHVTILKAMGGGGGDGHGENGGIIKLAASMAASGDYNSSRSNNSSVIATGGGSSTPGKNKVKFKAGSALATTVRMAGGGGPHGGGAHMTVVKARGAGAGVSMLHSGGPPATKAGGYEFCPPCGMWKAVCRNDNGYEFGQTNILPACNNISSR